MATTKPKKGAEKTRKIPQRRCVGCGGTYDKKELLRVVRSPLPKEENAENMPGAERISIDFTGKKSGRGAYICMKEECLAKARKTGRLRSSLECEITDDVYEELAKEIRLGVKLGENP